MRLVGRHRRMKIIIIIIIMPITTNIVGTKYMQLSGNKCKYNWWMETEKEKKKIALKKKWLHFHLILDFGFNVQFHFNILTNSLLLLH